MQMGAGRIARVSAPTDHLTGLDPITFPDVKFGKVRKINLVGPVFQHQVITVTIRIPARFFNPTRKGSLNRSSHHHGIIDRSMSGSDTLADPALNWISSGDVLRSSGFLDLLIYLGRTARNCCRKIIPFCGDSWPS